MEAAGNWTLDKLGQPRSSTWGEVALGLGQDQGKLRSGIGGCSTIQ